MKKILSTKTLSQENLELGSIFGWQIESMSFIDIKPMINEEVINLVNELSKENIVAIFTSVKSIEILKTYIIETPQHWKVICINGPTKNAVEYWLGNQSILYSGNDAAEIIPSLHLFKRDKIVYFCGKKRLDAIPDYFKTIGKEFTEIQLYDTLLNSEKVEKEYDAYLFFSPSGVNSFFENNIIPDNKLVVSIGNTTGNALREFYQGEIMISDQPSVIGIYQKLNEYYVKNKQ